VSRLPLRVRLVAGFVVAMLVLLTAAGAFVYWRVEYALDRGLDAELDQATTVITPLVAPTGRVTSPAAADATGAGWQVLDENGSVLDSGGTAPTDPLVRTADLGRVRSGAMTEDIGKLLPIADKPYRVQVTALDPTDHFLVVGVRRDHRDEALRELVAQLTIAGLGALAVAALVGDLLARAALRPVERYRRRAAEIAGGAGGLRLDVPDGRDDEITRLGRTLNDMLAALERSLEHERRFVDEASHELRTPLTVLKSRIQLARRRPRTVEEHETVLDELAVDVTRLTDLAEQLLALGSAGADTGSSDVRAAVNDVVVRRRLAFPDQEVELKVTADAAPLRVAVERIALERVVDNLLANAFVHGEPPVRVYVERVDASWVRITVEDGGPGMDPGLLAEATQRFTRSAEARSRPGAGLGLSLVEQIVDLAGGELRLCDGDDHVVHGHPAPVPCEHAATMTVTVLLPTLEDHTSPT
jgi:signal transduction histidine kinase